MEYTHVGGLGIDDMDGSVANEAPLIVIIAVEARRVSQIGA